MHDSALLLIEVGAVLLGLSLLSRLADRIGISAIPFYLLPGLAFGVGGFVPLDAGNEFFTFGSELGVILLLVMLGLEYSPTELITSLKQSRKAGILDVLLNALPGATCALILGWGPMAAVALAGITWVSSSGVTAKVLRDLRRLGNRETPTILSILVIEDLAMAFYLPVLSALVIGAGVLAGATALVVALLVVAVILYLALRHGRVVSRLFAANHSESLVLGVLRLTMLVAGIAPVLLPAAILAVVTIGTKTLTGYRAAAAAGIGVPGRWRTGFALTPRGEFSMVIAGLAAGSGIEPRLAPLATAYVLLTVIAGPILAWMTDASWFRRRISARQERLRAAGVASELG